MKNKISKELTSLILSGVSTYMKSASENLQLEHVHCIMRCGISSMDADRVCIEIKLHLLNQSSETITLSRPRVHLLSAGKELGFVTDESKHYIIPAHETLRIPLSLKIPWSSVKNALQAVHVLIPHAEDFQRQSLWMLFNAPELLKKLHPEVHCTLHINGTQHSGSLLLPLI